MSVAPYLSNQASKPKRGPSRQGVVPSQTAQPTRTARRRDLSRTSQQGIAKLPQPNRQLPPELRSLLNIQKGSSAIAFALVSLTLAAYAWTVYIPKQWSQEYRKLETLQRRERHLTATNETLKNQLAQQAEKPEMGLSDPHPTNVIFLPPLTGTLVSKAQSPKSDENDNPSLATKTPIAY